MSVTNNIADVLQKNVPPAQDTPVDQKMVAASDPQTDAALSVLSAKPDFFSGGDSQGRIPGPVGPKNTDPGTTPDVKDDSKDFSSKFGSTLGQLLALKGLGGTGSAMTPFIAAALPGMMGGDWSTARKNDDATTPTQAPQKPDRAATVQRLINGNLADLGAAVSPLDQAGHRNGGALAGAANVAKATYDRTANEQRDRIATATANATMLHEQALTHKMGEDAIAAATETGKRGLEMMMTAHVPGQKLADGVNSDQLNKMIQKGQIDPSQDTVFLTGRTLTGKDANGLPMYRSTYTVVKPGGPIKLTEKDAEYLNKRLGTNYGGGHKDENGNLVSDGQELPAAMLNQEWQRAQIVDANDYAAKKFAAEAGVVDHQISTSADAQTLRKSDKFTQMLKENKTTPTDPDAVMKTYNQLKTNKDLQTEMGLDPANFEEAFQQYATGSGPGAAAAWNTEKEKYREQYQKTQDKAKATIGNDEFTVQHPTEQLALVATRSAELEKDWTDLAKIASDETKSDSERIIAQTKMTAIEDEAKVVKRTQQLATQALRETNKQAGAKSSAETEARLKAEEGDFGKYGDTNLRGQEYINSLPTGMQATLKAVAEGRELRSPRQFLDKNGEPTAFAKALSLAYPDYDIHKGAAYGDVLKRFTAGKMADDLDHGSTALKHLNELQMLNTLDSRRPESAAKKAYDNKLNTVVHELMTFYHMPATNDSVESLKSGMGGFWNRDAAILSQAQSMMDRFESIHQEWKNGQPRESYTPPMPGISDDAKKAMLRLQPDFVKDHSQDWSIQPEQTNPNQHPVADPKAAPQPQPKAEHVPASKAAGYAEKDTFQSQGWNWVVDKVNPDGSILASHATTKVQ